MQGAYFGASSSGSCQSTVSPAQDGTPLGADVLPPSMWSKGCMSWLQMVEKQTKKCSGRISYTWYITFVIPVGHAMSLYLTFPFPL